MATINAQAKTIYELLGNVNQQFVIPDYQRPYAWTIEQCKTLCEDLTDFVIDDGKQNYSEKEREKYFLGNVTFFKNERNQSEIIDGQQRIITLTLLLRAFYEHFQNNAIESARKTFDSIELCLWLTDDLQNRDLNRLKVTSDFLEKQENSLFKNLLTTGTASKSDNDNFSQNYLFFNDQVKDWATEFAGEDFVRFVRQILNNCYVVQIETNTQDEALQVFTSVNDRGLPLNMTDIFRSVLYKKFAAQGVAEKYKFVDDWEKLKQISKKIFPVNTKTIPLEMLLTCYTKAFEDSRNITDLKKFFEKDNYKKLLADNFIPDLFELLGFWQDIYEQNTMRFSQVTLRKFFTLLRILAARPMKALSGLFFYLRKENKLHDENLLNELLDRYTVYILASAFTGVTSNIDRIKWKTSDWATLETSPEEIFKDRKIHKASVENIFRNFQDVRNKAFVRQAVLSYWFFKDETQELPSPKDKFSIEHIVARDMTNFQKFHEPDLIESLGNMAFLESRINTRANNSTFAIKKQCYLGFIDKGKHSPGTVNRELQRIAQTLNDFTETDVRNRNEEMLQAVLDLLSKYNLLR